MDTSIKVLIYIILIASSVSLICVTSAIKHELREQRRFRRDFYTLVSRYDRELSNEFNERNISDFEANDSYWKSGKRAQ